jgi:hypothetical protein
MSCAERSVAVARTSRSALTLLLTTRTAESGVDRAKVGYCRPWRGSAVRASWSGPPIEVLLSYG